MPDSESLSDAEMRVVIEKQREEINALQTTVDCYRATRSFWSLTLRQAIEKRDLAVIQAETERVDQVQAGWIRDSHEAASLRLACDDLAATLKWERVAFDERRKRLETVEQTLRSERDEIERLRGKLAQRTDAHDFDGKALLAARAEVARLQAEAEDCAKQVLTTADERNAQMDHADKLETELITERGLITLLEATVVTLQQQQSLLAVAELQARKEIDNLLDFGMTNVREWMIAATRARAFLSGPSTALQVLAERDAKTRHEGEATGRDDARNAVVDMLTDDVMLLAGEEKWKRVFAAIAVRDAKTRAEAVDLYRRRRVIHRDTLSHGREVVGFEAPETWLAEHDTKTTAQRDAQWVYKLQSKRVVEYPVADHVMVELVAERVAKTRHEGEATGRDDVRNAVVMTCDEMVADLKTANDLLTAVSDRAVAEREQLHGDLIDLLRTAGIATPAEGYIKARYLLADDIARLAHREWCKGRSKALDEAIRCINAADDALEVESSEMLLQAISARDARVCSAQRAELAERLAKGDAYDAVAQALDVKNDVLGEVKKLLAAVAVTQWGAPPETAKRLAAEQALALTLRKALKAIARNGCTRGGCCSACGAGEEEDCKRNCCKLVAREALENEAKVTGREALRTLLVAAARFASQRAHGTSDLKRGGIKFWRSEEIADLVLEGKP